MSRAIEILLRSYLREEPPDDWDADTAVESPAALREARRTGKPPARSGEYLKAEFANAVRDSKKEKAR